jgi:GT2 family glycosyltransferase
MARVFGMVTTRASADYTTVATESFFRQTPMQTDAFLLIDNDGGWSERHESVADRRIEIVRNPEPLSFAQNANQIIGRAHLLDADAYILNNDIVFTQDWIGPLSAALPAVMTPTCNQNFQYQKGKLELKAVMTLEEFRLAADELPAVLSEHRGLHQQMIEAYKTNFFCVKIPPVVYRKVGLFDTRFGVAGGEDDDYCIRAYLHGFRVIVAQASYLVHFGGRATWSGPETRQQWAAREQNFIRVFREKWGPTLARFLLWRDPSVVSRDPSLQTAQQQAGIRGLMQEMARRDGIRVEDVLETSPCLES